MAIKEVNPKCKIIGVVPENSSSMEALFNNKVVPGFKPTIADGTAVKTPSPVIYENFIKKYVDAVYAIDEGSIASAIVYLLERAKTLVEGAGALPLAAIMSGCLSDLGEKTCLILSGGNIDMNTISQVIRRGLTQAGRIARFRVVVPDHPGILNSLTDVIAQHEANVLEVYHDRLGSQLNLQETVIEFLLEIRDLDQFDRIVKGFKELGAEVIKNP